MGAVFHTREEISGGVCLGGALFLVHMLMKKELHCSLHPLRTESRKGFSTMMYNSECSEQKSNVKNGDKK